MEKLIEEFSVGLFFWQTVLFIALIFLLRKFAWKPILNAVIEREEKIEGALKAAEEAENKMKELSANNEKILADARVERENILKDGRSIKEKMIADAKSQASTEAEKIITSAKEQINIEKMKAMTEIKNQVADISIEMAEKILRTELKDAKNQKKLIEEALKKQIN
ncbi:MAG: ATP synthase F0 subunit B [Crocinitomicaceae bacterium]|jgi:F-type H+-transporting ATPase subunit b|nr:ATP synthase F0 subunit B [Crocinitomicaceae bacterium]MEC9159734.1 F0F1 ATP synthase subunit B [Bacteroidota bacterium]|tara:strand:+ start:532 stop:1029 length:498 start_codon:yes stop_codon:yes gene_type:complete